MCLRKACSLGCATQGSDTDFENGSRKFTQTKNTYSSDILNV